ncbi:MAG: ATP-binding protein [Desulfobacterales bacterium]|nr:ATP-binding protein [Desulfobacterales bacterium]
MRLSLKYKFLVPTLLILMVGMGTISVFAHYTAKSALTRTIRDEIDNVAVTTVNSMSTWIHNRKLDIGNWSQQGVYKKALLTSFLGITARDFAVAQLKRIKQDYGYYKNIILADAAGNILASADSTLAGHINIDEDLFFQEALKGRLYLSDHAVKSRVDDHLVFMISAPVWDKGKVVGVLFSVFDVNTFAKTFIKPIGIGEHGYAYIFTGDGFIVSNPEQTEIFGRQITEFRFGREMQKKGSGVIEYELNSQPIFASYKKLGKLDWTIAVCAFKDEVFSSVNSLKQVNFMVTAAIVIILAIVLFMLTESLSKPIREVVYGLKWMGKGHLDFRLEIKMPEDEVGEIGRALNKMAENLELSDLKIKEQNKLLEKARDELELRVEKRTADLKQAKEKYRGIFENAVEGIFQVSDQGYIMNANPALASILGYASVDQILNREIFSLILVPGETKSILENYLESQDEVIGYETRLFRIDRTPFWCSISARRLINGTTGKTYFEGFVVDITQRREMETAQRERKAAEAANRAKSEFLANMSHEIRTPLNALLGFSELLAKDMTDPKHRAYTDAIKISGKSLLTLINDILDLSKIEAGRMELSYGPVSIPDLFTEIEQIFKGKITEKNLNFIMNLEQGMPQRLELDESRIRQILLNLVGNAIKFTKKGHIRLAAKTKPGKSDEQFDLILSVTDTGPGIDRTHLDVIFDSFRQVDGHLKKNHGGTGLGLTICKRLVQAMNGKISVNSTVGQGSRFEICLKNVVVSGTETAEAPRAIGRDVVFKRGLVLVVDDETFNRYMLSELLIKLNLDVIEAENGKQAIAMAKKEQPNIIIMDIRMPVLDGNKATAILKSDPATKDIPVLALTGDLVSLPGNPSAPMGYDGYLGKPVELDALLAQLSRFLDTCEAEQEPLPRPMDFLDNLRLEEVINPESLAHLLETEFLPRCHAFDDSLVISRVTEYGEQLLNTAEKHNLQPLVAFSQDLLESSAVFDITRIKKNLNNLPGLIRDLIHYLKKEN